MADKELPGKDTELFVFDLDGTLAPSKQPIEPEMVETLKKLIAKRRVAVIGGGSFEVFQNQFKAMMESGDQNLKNLSLFPTSGAQYFKYDNGWHQMYEHGLSEGQRKKIISAVKQAIRESGVEMPKQTYGEVIEDRGTQITMSALGQTAPLALKKDWDTDIAKRHKIKKILDKLIPEFEVRIGGTSSIDVTKKGVDKAYGVRMMQYNLKVPVHKMFFVGDALFPGGNDYAVLSTCIKVYEVKDTLETRKFIESILPNLD